MIELLFAPLLIGLMLAAVSGPLGCVVVWGRMAYFGDTLAHSALLGIALGYLLGLSPVIGVIVISSLLAIALALLQRQHMLANDTLLGIIAHGALATGLVIVSMMEGVRVDLMGFLFGDVLASNQSDLLWTLPVAGLILGLLALIWRPLLNITISSDLAKAEGVAVTKIRFVYLTLLACTVAIGMQVVGALLITALLIIPAATARKLASTPEQMALLASGFGGLAVLCGMLLSWYADTPAGPSIVMAATLMFIIVFTLKANPK